MHIVLAALVALLVGCSHTPPPVEESPVKTTVAQKATPASPAAAQRPATHRVQKGDTLFSIAWRYGLDYHELARINGIDSSYTIYPGQILRLAAPAVPATTRASAAGTSTANTPTVTKPPGSAAKPAASKPSVSAAVAPGNSAGTWQWPARGKVVNDFNAAGVGPKGISIAGNPGDPVRAARDGRVVYTGSGLVGYGQLVIVKHDDVYLSAYAHNSKLLVKEGDAVKAGELIAEMGSSGTTRTELHFEVRRNGDPIDPATVLPKP